jgi:hypothetical protein
MLRKFVCAVAILGFSLGLAVAEELKGKITKVDAEKSTISFQVKGADAKEYDAKGAKVFKKDGDNKVAVDGGLKAKEFGKIGDKGVNAMINVDGGKVTEIVLAGKKAK